MKFKLALLAAGLVAAGVVFGSARRDDKFEAFIVEFDAATGAIVKEVEGELTPASVARAQKVLDERRDGLKKRLDELKDIPNTQVTPETLARFQSSIQANRAYVRKVFIENAAVEKAVKDDQNFLRAVVELIEDYVSLIE